MSASSLRVPETLEIDLPASPLVHESLRFARSCIVSIPEARQSSRLTNDMLQLRGGTEGRLKGRLGTLFLDASGLFYSGERRFGGQRSHDRQISGRAAIEAFRDSEDAADKLIIIKGMDGQTRSGANAEALEVLAEDVINKPNEPMLLAICTARWRLESLPNEADRGTPAHLISKFKTGVELDVAGNPVQCLGEPTLATTPQPVERLDLQSLIEVPTGNIRLGVKTTA